MATFSKENSLFKFSDLLYLSQHFFSNSKSELALKILIG